MLYNFSINGYKKKINVKNVSLNIDLKTINIKNFTAEVFFNIMLYIYYYRVKNTKQLALKTLC